MHDLRFSLILYGLAWLFRFTAWRHPAFRARLKEMNLTAQLKTYDGTVGRWYELRDGRVLTGSAFARTRRQRCRSRRRRSPPAF